MKREFAGTGVAGIISFIGIGFAIDTAEAACRQILAPNRWQYITVCDSYRSGSDYSGAVAAGVTGAAIALELLPGVLDSVGGITSGVGDITSSVVENFGNAASNTADPLQNFLGARNQSSGGQNDGTLNPFNFFNQQPEAAAKKKNANRDEAPSLFPNIFGPPSPPTNPNVRTPTTNQPSAANSPLPNIFSPQAPSTNAPRTSTPQVSSSQPQ